MKRFILVLFALCTVVALAAPTQKSTPGKIPKNELKKLRVEGVRFVIPSYVPAGFKFKSLAVEVDKAAGFTKPSDLTLEYANRSGGSFTIQMASEGIGDIVFGDGDEATSSKDFTSPLLGLTTMEFLDAKDRHEFHFDWVDLGEKAQPRFVLILGEGLSHASAIKLALGLRFYK